MTQTQLVRITEELVFTAECAAIHKRAMMRVGQRQAKRDQQAREWMPKGIGALRFNAIPKMPVATPEPTPKPARAKRERNKATIGPAKRQTPGPKPVTINRGGKFLTVKQWAETLGISIGTMRSRITRLGSIEAAIDAGPVQRQPKGLSAGGYVETSHHPLGTGGGRHETDFDGDRENGHEL